jgi:hypothetical protein
VKTVSVDFGCKQQAKRDVLAYNNLNLCVPIEHRAPNFFVGSLEESALRFVTIRRKLTVARMVQNFPPGASASPVWTQCSEFLMELFTNAFPETGSNFQWAMSWDIYRRRLRDVEMAGFYDRSRKSGYLVGMLIFIPKRAIESSG